MAINTNTTTCGFLPAHFSSDIPGQVRSLKGSSNSIGRCPSYYPTVSKHEMLKYIILQQHTTYQPRNLLTRMRFAPSSSIVSSVSCEISSITVILLFTKNSFLSLCRWFMFSIFLIRLNDKSNSLKQFFIDTKLRHKL